MEEKQKALVDRLARLSGIFALAVPLVILLGENMMMNLGGEDEGLAQISRILSYVSLASTAFGSSILFFGARRLTFRQCAVLAAFPIAASMLTVVGAMNVLRSSSGAAGLPTGYICAVYLRLCILPFLLLLLCGLWSKPLKNEALYAGASIFLGYVIGSVTNWLVGGLLPTGADGGFVRSAPISFGEMFWFNMLVEAAGYFVLWLLLRKALAPDFPAD